MLYSFYHGEKAMLKKFAKSREGLLLGLIIVFSLVVTVVNPQFLTLENIFSLLKSWTVIGIFALGVLIVMLSGGFDVSFTAIAQVTQYIIVYYFLQYSVDNIFLAIFLSLIIGALLGLINGLLIYYCHVTAIIVTIATNSLFYGTLYVVTRGELIYDIPQGSYWYSVTFQFDFRPI